MGADINRGRLGRQPSSATAYLTVSGFLALVTVLYVWAARPDAVPAIFGVPGGRAVIALSLIAFMVTVSARRAGRRFRLVMGTVTILLGLAAAVLAWGQFAGREGAADVGLAGVLAVGVVAMYVAAVRALRGVPDR